MSDTPHPNRSYRSPLHGFGVVMSWGLQRALRGRRAWLGLILAAGLGFLIGAGSQEGQADKLGALWTAIDTFLLRMVAPVIALLMIAQGFASEVTGGTLLYHLVRPVRRPVVYVARFFSGWIMGIAASMALVAGVALSATGVPITIWLKLFVAFAALMTASGALYYVLSSTFKRGLIIGLVYTFMIEVTLGSMPGSIQKAAINHHARAIYHGWCDGWFAENSTTVRKSLDGSDSSVPNLEMIQEALGIGYGSPTTAILVLVCTAAAALALGVFFIKRREFPLKD